MAPQLPPLRAGPPGLRTESVPEAGLGTPTEPMTAPVVDGAGPASGEGATIQVDLGALGATGATGRQAPAELRTIPAQFLGYRPVRQLGVGGMGVVYEAFQERLKRSVALKLMKPDVSSRHQFAERFLRESKAMAAVTHPNVVTIYDAGEHDGFLYMALEFVPGGDLNRLLQRRGTLDAATALTMLIGCCRGLGAIHAAGLVHRDIKPLNIFLDRSLTPKIGDLGLARAADGEDRMTMTGAAWGTPAYMSPEQVRGLADIDIRSDLYALGATLFTMTTGSEPFTGATSYIVTHQVLTQPTPDPRSRNRLIPPAVVAIIFKAMAKDREQRYATPEQLLQDLTHARDGMALVHAAMPLGFNGAASEPAGPVPPQESLNPTQLRSAVLTGMTMPVLAHHAPRSLSTISGLSPTMIKLAAALVVVGVLYGVGRSISGHTYVDAPAQAPLAPTTADTTSWAGATGTDANGRWAELVINDATMRFRWCRPGTYDMGSPADEPGRDATETRHQVTISHGFWLASTLCTEAQWAAITGAHGGEITDPTLPKTMISRNDCDQALRQLSLRCAPLVARLPTEAEWEYACRAGSPLAFSGSSTCSGLGWSASGAVLASWKAHADEANPRLAVEIDMGGMHSDPALGLHPVQQLRANAWGLYDMHGDAAQWCADSWNGSEALPEAAETDPQRSGGMAVVRGGSWWLPAEQCRSAARGAQEADARQPWLGMRIVIGLPLPSPLPRH